MPINSIRVPLGSRMPWFEVLDLDGRAVTTEHVPPGQVALVAFLCNHSPYVLRIEAALREAARRWLDQGVFVLGISSNDERAYPSDCRAQMRAQLERSGWPFSYAFDESQRAAKAFGAACTPEFFLYDRLGRLVYHGQFDSYSPTVDPPESNDDVSRAIESVLAGQPVARRQRAAFGCSIKWRAGNEPSYLFTSSTARAR